MILGTHFCYRLRGPGRVRSLEKSKGLIGKRTSDFAAPPAPPAPPVPERISNLNRYLLIGKKHISNT
jgi:hypothetical protein